VKGLRSKNMKNLNIIHIYNTAEYLNILFISLRISKILRSIYLPGKLWMQRKKIFIILFLIKDFEFITYYLELQIKRNR
jgi:hypothetical protein